MPKTNSQYLKKFRKRNPYASNVSSFLRLKKKHCSRNIKSINQEEIDIAISQFKGKDYHKFLDDTLTVEKNNISIYPINIRFINMSTQSNNYTCYLELNHKDFNFRIRANSIRPYSKKHYSMYEDKIFYIDFKFIPKSINTEQYYDELTKLMQIPYPKRSIDIVKFSSSYTYEKYLEEIKEDTDKFSCDTESIKSLAVNYCLFFFTMTNEHKLQKSSYTPNTDTYSLKRKHELTIYNMDNRFNFIDHSDEKPKLSLFSIEKLNVVTIHPIKLVSCPGYSKHPLIKGKICKSYIPICMRHIYHAYIILDHYNGIFQIMESSQGLPCQFSLNSENYTEMEQFINKQNIESLISLHPVINDFNYLRINDITGKPLFYQIVGTRQIQNGFEKITSSTKITHCTLKLLEREKDISVDEELKIISNIWTILENPAVLSDFFDDKVQNTPLTSTQLSVFENLERENNCI